MEANKPRLSLRKKVVHEETSAEAVNVARNTQDIHSDGITGMIDGSVTPIDRFLATDFPDRMAILSPLLTEGTVMLVQGRRDAGKEWLTMAMGVAVTRGLSFGFWKTDKPVGCLLVDGGLPCAEIQHTLRHLTEDLEPEKAPLLIQSAGDLRSRNLPVPDITDENWRGRTYRYFGTGKSNRLLILNNMLARSPFGKEITNPQWECINQWIFSLASLGVAVVLTNHTDGGKRNTKGSIARLDCVNVFIDMTRIGQNAQPQGLKFHVNPEDRRCIQESDLRPIFMTILEHRESAGTLPIYASNAGSHIDSVFYE